MSPEDLREAAAPSAAEPTGEAGTELPAAEGGEAPEAADNLEPRSSWADLSQDAPELSTSQPSDPAPPLGPAGEETDPALASLSVSEEAAFGASAVPPSPEHEPRFDALSLLEKPKEEDVTFDQITTELERDLGVVEPGLEETAASCEEFPVTQPESDNPENPAELGSSNPLEPPNLEPDSDRTLSPVETSEFPEFPDWGEGVPEEVAQEGTEESRAAAPVYVQFSEQAEEEETVEVEVEEEVPPPPTSPFLVAKGAAVGAPTTEPIQVGHTPAAPSRPPREKKRGTKGGLAKRRAEQITSWRRDFNFFADWLWIETGKGFNLRYIFHEQCDPEFIWTISVCRSLILHCTPNQVLVHFGNIFPPYRHWTNFGGFRKGESHAVGLRILQDTVLPDRDHINLQAFGQVDPPRSVWDHYFQYQGPHPKQPSKRQSAFVRNTEPPSETENPLGEDPARFPSKDSDVGEAAEQRQERAAAREAAAKAPQQPDRPPPGWAPSLRPLSHNSAAADSATARSSTDIAPRASVPERAAPKRPKSPSKAATSVEPPKPKQPKPAQPRKASEVGPLREQPPVPPPNRPAPRAPPPAPRLHRTSGEPQQPPSAIPPPPSHPPPSRAELEGRESRGRTRTVVGEAAQADKSAAPRRRTGRSRTPVVATQEDPGVALLRRARQQSVPPAPHSLGGRPAALRPSNPQYPKSVSDRSGTWTHSGGFGGATRPPSTVPIFTGSAAEPYDETDPYSLSDEVWRQPDLVGGSTVLAHDRTEHHQITEPDGVPTQQAPYPPASLRKRRRSQTVPLCERRSAFHTRRRTSTTATPQPDPVEPVAPEEEDPEDLPDAASPGDPSSEPPEAPEELGDEEEGEEEEDQEQDAVVEEAAEAPPHESQEPEAEEAEHSEPSLPTTVRGSAARFLASPPTTPRVEVPTETRSRSRGRGVEAPPIPIARTIQKTNVTGRLEIQIFPDGRRSQVFVPDVPIPKVPPSNIKRPDSAPPKVKPPPAGLKVPPKRASSATASSAAAAPAPQSNLPVDPPGFKPKERKAPPKPKIGEVVVETRAYEPGYESSPEPTPEDLAKAIASAEKARDKKYEEDCARLAKKSRDEQLKEYLNKEHKREDLKRKGTKVRPPPKTPPTSVPPKPDRPVPKGPRVEVPVPQIGGASSSATTTIPVPKPSPPPTPPSTPKAAGPHPWQAPVQPAQHPKPPAAHREHGPERPPLTEEEQTQARLRRYRQDTSEWYSRSQRARFIDTPPAVPSPRLKVFFDWHDTLDCALNALYLFDDSIVEKFAELTRRTGNNIEYHIVSFAGGGKVRSTYDQASDLCEFLRNRGLPFKSVSVVSEPTGPGGKVPIILSYEGNILVDDREDVCAEATRANIHTLQCYKSETLSWFPQLHNYIVQVGWKKIKEKHHPIPLRHNQYIHNTRR
eukprot:s2193_g7.t1